MLLFIRLTHRGFLLQLFCRTRKGESFIKFSSHSRFPLFSDSTKCAYGCLSSVWSPPQMSSKYWSCCVYHCLPKRISCKLVDLGPRINCHLSTILIIILFFILSFPIFLFSFISIAKRTFEENVAKVTSIWTTNLSLGFGRILRQYNTSPCRPTFTSWQFHLTVLGPVSYGFPSTDIFASISNQPQFSILFIPAPPTKSP